MIVDYWKKEREQFEQLCKKHGVTITFMHRLVHIGATYMFQACAFPKRKIVNIPNINSAETYMTALHELGHCVVPAANPNSDMYAEERERQGFFDSYFTMPSVVKIELAAWKFAIQNALPEIWECDTAITNIWFGYSSYYNGCVNDGLKHGRKFKMPTSRNKYSQAILNKDAKVLASLSKLA